MPELPEVETIRRGLERELVGRRIERADWRQTRLRAASPMPITSLTGRTVVGVLRRGKFLLVHLDTQETWLVHLGMTGKLLFAARDEAERPHTHLRLHLDDDRELRYVDPRRFGMLRLYPPGVAPDDTAHYGLDALSPELDAAHLCELLKRSKAPLKAFLLDQTKIAGLGNIYVCEALWRSGLSPRRLACNTPRAKVPLLHASIVETLEDSLAQGGTSFNDYVNEIGEPGKFVADLAVFQREGEPCARCGTDIRRIVQSNRSTFYCPKCQQ